MKKKKWVSTLKLEVWLETYLTGCWLSLKNEKTPILCLVNTGVEPAFSKISRLRLQKYWSHAGQVKRKVNCEKLSLKFNSIRIATHKESLALKHDQIHVEKWIAPLRGLFQQEARRASCQERISCSQQSTRINLKTCKII